MAHLCRLHLRYPGTYAEIAHYVAKLVEVFALLKTGVVFVEASAQAVANGDLDAVDAGDCSGAPTQDVDDLFSTYAPTPLAAGDITVFFATRLTGGARLGCANHPAGCRGVIVSCEAKPMVLPHEIGHLFLGHYGDTSNLMYDNSDLIDDPPMLLQWQLDDMDAATWTATAEEAVYAEVAMANGGGIPTMAKAKKKAKKAGRPKKQKAVKKVNAAKKVKPTKKGSKRKGPKKKGAKKK